MSTDSKPVIQLPNAWNTTKIISLVPQNWRNVEVFIGDSIGNGVKIRRVSLHTNRSGRRVVLLHAKESEPQE